MRSEAAPEMRIELYDTTLRDGAQREGIAFTCSDKLRIAQALDGLGVALIEGGWPGSNPKDVEFFRRARDLAWEHATIAAFGSTRRAGVMAGEDPSVVALIDSGAAVCTIFGKSSTVHVKDVLRTTLDENLRMIEETVAFLVASGRRVVYDAEHFFDGAALDEAYALETLRAAERGGAECVVLCDTNGGTLPWDVAARVRDVRAAVSARIGIHAHDDAGSAVANSLVAVLAGATQIQGTINGYGERCGNANLTTIIPSLELKLGKRCIREGALPSLRHVARLVAETANLAFDEHAPYVGRSAFAHKGGVHVAAIRRSPRSYEHVDPALVGNGTRVVVSELAGRANVLAFAEENDVSVGEGREAEVLARVKEREASGFAFESADASVALMMRREQPGYEAPFELVDYKVLMGHLPLAEHPFAEASIKLRIAGALYHTAADGNGPVSALDGALRRALAVSYPEISGIRLEDYKVRILDSREGTAAITRVLIDHADDADRWTTVGAAPNIVEASLTALLDGIEHGLWRRRCQIAMATESGPHLRTEPPKAETPRSEEDNDGHDRRLTG